MTPRSCEHPRGAQPLRTSPSKNLDVVFASSAEAADVSAGAESRFGFIVLLVPLKTLCTVWASSAARVVYF